MVNPKKKDGVLQETRHPMLSDDFDDRLKAAREERAIALEKRSRASGATDDSGRSHRVDAQNVKPDHVGDQAVMWSSSIDATDHFVFRNDVAAPKAPAIDNIVPISDTLPTAPILLSKEDRWASGTAGPAPSNRRAGGAVLTLSMLTCGILIGYGLASFNQNQETVMVELPLADRVPSVPDGPNEIGARSAVLPTTQASIAQPLQQPDLTALLETDPRLPIVSEDTALEMVIRGTETDGRVPDMPRLASIPSLERLPDVGAVPSPHALGNVDAPEAPTLYAAAGSEPRPPAAFLDVPLTVRAMAPPKLPHLAAPQSQDPLPVIATALSPSALMIVEMPGPPASVAMADATLPTVAEGSVRLFLPGLRLVNEPAADPLPFVGPPPGPRVLAFLKPPGQLISSLETAPVLQTPEMSPSPVIQPSPRPSVPQEDSFSCTGCAQTSLVMTDADIELVLPQTVTDAQAERIRQELQAIGIASITRRTAGLGVASDQVRFFHPSDAQAAADLARALEAELVSLTQYMPRPPAGTIELRFSQSGLSAGQEPRAASSQT